MRKTFSTYSNYISSGIKLYLEIIKMSKNLYLSRYRNDIFYVSTPMFDVLRNISEMSTVKREKLVQLKPFEETDCLKP